jgi:hypothetical protein
MSNEFDNYDNEFEKNEEEKETKKVAKMLKSVMQEMQNDVSTQCVEKIKQLQNKLHNLELVVHTIDENFEISKFVQQVKTIWEGNIEIKFVKSNIEGKQYSKFTAAPIVRDNFNVLSDNDKDASIRRLMIGNQNYLTILITTNNASFLLEKFLNQLKEIWNGNVEVSYQYSENKPEYEHFVQRIPYSF